MVIGRQQFQSIVIPTRGIVKHYAKLLCTMGKTHYLETLLYCTQLDCVGIRSYAQVEEGNVGEKIAMCGVRNIHRCIPFKNQHFPLHHITHVMAFQSLSLLSLDMCLYALLVLCKVIIII